MLLGKQHLYGSDRGYCGVSLLQLVRTVSILLNHLTNAPNLPFDSKQPLDERRALRVRAVQMKLSIPELGFHR